MVLFRYFSSFSCQMTGMIARKNPSHSCKTDPLYSIGLRGQFIEGLREVANGGVETFSRVMV